jgi:hypothetical protein
VARPRLVSAGEALGVEAARRLAAYAVCDIARGLSDAEFDRVEREFGFTFADDHRGFLTVGLPVNSGMPPPEPGVYYAHSKPWPDWRDDPPEILLDFLGWPAAGVLRSVENGAWPRSWGARPTGHVTATQVAKTRLAEVPAMIPIYGHRYLPAGRGGWGHPVLSMWGTDIISYGDDLADYIDREFDDTMAGDREPALKEATVAFWTDYLWPWADGRGSQVARPGW